MELLFQFFLLCIGLGLLWKGGGLAVQHAIGVSTLFGIHRFTIGFFIFAVSTGLPEISSAIVSSLKKIPELSAGDLMGSTFVNMSLVLGIVAAMAGKIDVESPLRKKLLWTTALILLIFIGLVTASDYKIFTGILLIVIYLGSFFLIQTKAVKQEAKEEIREIEEKALAEKKKSVISPKVDSVAKLAGSLALLLVSSWITVLAAAKIATLLGIRLSIIGATLIAIGTGLPELALEIHAVRRKEYALALGDIFGSSLLNVSLVLGLLLLINDRVDLAVAKTIAPFVLLAILWTLIRLIPQKPLRRIDGWIFLGLFLVYIAVLVTLSSDGVPMGNLRSGSH